jgi:hypothetical protein
MIVTHEQAEALLEAHKKVVEALLSLADAIQTVSEVNGELTTAVLRFCHKQEDHEVV